MTACPTHEHTPPPRPQRPFRCDQQPGGCKNYMNRLGTDGDRRAHVPFSQGRCWRPRTVAVRLLDRLTAEATSIGWLPSSLV
ncbi:hypothetical protein [Streptomyces sasae]|uniref:hypothetical protein n=1 Tax=Streptomyces sasae TaxID=1266772 RepID=UPI00292D7426|nr:hypothetical protein [Streptomyces sasae]